MKQQNNPFHSNVANPCFTCFMTLLLFYTCHITTMLPCFKVWETHVAFTCFTTTIHKQFKYETNIIANVAYACFSTMAWWDRWCICLWNEMHFCGSQTPRVLHQWTQAKKRTKQTSASAQRHASFARARPKSRRNVLNHVQPKQTVPCKIRALAPAKNRTWPSRLTTHYDSHDSRLSYGSFSYEMHPQPYLIGAHWEKYPLINHSLVSTIMF